MPACEFSPPSHKRHTLKEIILDYKHETQTFIKAISNCYDNRPNYEIIEDYLKDYAKRCRADLLAHISKQLGDCKIHLADQDNKWLEDFDVYE